MLSLLQDIFYYPIFNVLMFLYWLVGDFGLSIVLLTVLVRLALVPMTFKQLRSQRKMMEIQPQINALKEQYKGDQQGFARAQMQLMKENNVSMLGGCLPLLVQLPFLYGLFYALRDGLSGTVAHINDQIYPFLPFIHVTEPGGSHPLNPYLDWFSWLPGHPALNLNIADPTHILPILAALFTFIQMRMIQGRMQPKPAPAAGSSPKAAAQQNAQTQAMSLMAYITPLFTLWFAWQYAAGLALYWTVGTLFAIGQQYMIYGWGGLFKGIPRLEQWAEQKNAQHEARLQARLAAKEVSAAPKVVESTLASPNGASRNGAKGKDWIDQAKAETEQTAASKKGRAAAPRPFPTLVKEKAATPDAAKTASPSSNGTASSKTGSGGASAKGHAQQSNAAKAGAQPKRGPTPPRSGTLPKPKGGKK